MQIDIFGFIIHNLTDKFLGWYCIFTTGDTDKEVLTRKVNRSYADLFRALFSDFRILTTPLRSHDTIRPVKQQIFRKQNKVIKILTRKIWEIFSNVCENNEKWSTMFGTATMTSKYLIVKPFLKSSP